MRASCRKFPFIVALVATLLLRVGGLQADDKDKAPAKPIRVLFVGNSQIYFNDLPAIVEALAESAPPERPRIKAGRALVGGASLETHWNRGTGKGTARAMIAEEKWDYVVLQEIYNGKPESFNKHARLFDELIQKNGAKTVLFSTASINSLYPKGFQGLHGMNVALGKELKVALVPAGNAWLYYWGKTPTEEQRLALYDKDMAHPGKKGSYIYACTIYAVLTGQSPVGLTHRVPKWPDDTITADEAKRFQEAGWREYKEISGKAAPAPKP
jgi:hypothetical protein